MGLLAVPDRRYNGYKQYRVEHLVELIRLRRLADLGVPLAQMKELDLRGPIALAAIDTELEADIARLQRARTDVAAILRENAPPETPRGFEAVAARLSEADRSLIQILTRLYEPAEQSALLAHVANEPADVRTAFDELHPDADEGHLDRVASLLSADGPHWRTPESAPRPVRSAFTTAVTELYSPVQREVLRRAAASVLI